MYVFLTVWPSSTHIHNSTSQPQGHSLEAGHRWGGGRGEGDGGGGMRGEGGSSFIQSLGRICPGLTIKVKRPDRWRCGAGEVGFRAAVARLSMTVLRLRDCRGLSGGLLLTPLTRNLATGTAWDVQVQVNSTANLTGYCVTCPAAFSFTGPAPWHKSTSDHHSSIPVYNPSHLVLFIKGLGSDGSTNSPTPMNQNMLAISLIQFKLYCRAVRPITFYTTNESIYGNCNCNQDQECQ